MLGIAGCRDDRSEFSARNASIGSSSLRRVLSLEATLRYVSDIQAAKAVSDKAAETVSNFEYVE